MSRIDTYYYFFTINDAPYNDHYFSYCEALTKYLKLKKNLY